MFSTQTISNATAVERALALIKLISIVKLAHHGDFVENVWRMDQPPWVVTLKVVLNVDKSL